MDTDTYKEILARYHVIKDEDDHWFKVCTRKFSTGVESPTEEELTNWEKSREALQAVLAELHEYVVKNT